ncbi:MAG: hypothetical protein K8S99_09405, partial [Planctomycetes bacterium]|nr:hypothetical protein [Planctomycetota bacterium]
RWGSLSARADGERAGMLCDAWPVDRPRNWSSRVNRPETAAELEALRLSVRRGRPYGGAAWSLRTAAAMGLESTTRPRGRPRKTPEKDPAR